MNRKRRKTTQQMPKFEARWPKPKRGEIDWAERFEKIAAARGFNRSEVARLLIEEWTKLVEASPDIIATAAKKAVHKSP